MTHPAAPEPSKQLESAAPDRSEDSVRAAGTQRWSPLLGAAAIAVYAALALAAAVDQPAAFLGLLLVTQVLDTYVARDDYVRAVLARGQFGIATRSLARELTTVVLVVQAGWAPFADRRAAALLALAVAGLRLAYLLALVPVRRRAAVPVETRGVDLSGLALPPVPHPLMATRASERAHTVSWGGLVLAAVGVVADSPLTVYVGTGLVVATELAATAWLGRLLLVGRRRLSREQLGPAVAARVARLRPEVVLYHSGDPDSAYQVNMWLSTMDRLPQSCVVVLRERPLMLEVAPSESPVLCIPDPVDFMTFPLPDVRVALYTANVGKTIHMLREPGVRHVFIGHGDSDKSASTNPFSKVYSEIWVAGPAGRDRYRRAGVGIDDDDIVEVGRPQLSGIEHYSGRPRDPLTVLYAPTWEGWTNDPAHTSVVRTGPRLVEQLVALPGVRVVYKPHPLTGTVSPAAGAADRAIRAVVERAAAGGAAHSVATGPSPTLYDCFNDADVLVADISSVLTDFLESQKPYLVANLTGRPDDDFRATFPSVSAAYLVDAAASGIAAVLDRIRTDDPLAGERRDLKRYLLGEDEPDALTRFATAVDSARARAIEECPVRPMLGATAT